MFLFGKFQFVNLNSGGWLITHQDRTMKLSEIEQLIEHTFNRYQQMKEEIVNIYISFCTTDTATPVDINYVNPIIEYTEQNRTALEAVIDTYNVLHEREIEEMHFIPFKRYDIEPLLRGTK